METPKLPLTEEQAKEFLNKIGYDQVLSITLNGYDSMRYTNIQKIIATDLFHVSTPHSGDIVNEEKLIIILMNIKHGVWNFEMRNKY